MSEKTLAGRLSGARLFSPAKLNLGLWVVGRRPDGYHLLESLFWPLDFGDDIEIRMSATGPRVHMEWTPDAPAPTALPAETDNLVTRLRREAPQLLPPEAVVHIRKRIPLGGGLGGGSSNAGTLLGRLSERPASKLAVRLGADVPFFLDPRPTWVSGIGERLRPLTTAVRPHFLLVFLPRPTPTAAVFARFREGGRFSEIPRPLPDRADEAAFFAYLAAARNDLEAAAAHHFPLIGEVLRRLRETSCFYAGMSGSGSTCFGVYPDSSTAADSAKDLSAFFREKGCTSLSVGTFQ